MYFGFSGVLTAACLGLRPSYALDLPAFLDLITIWTLFELRLDHDGHRHNCYGLGLTTHCSTCKTRMSSLMHDSHFMCTNCHERDCNLDNRCVECEGWSEEAMLKYIKYRKSLDSKSKSKKDKKISASSDQASLPSCRDSNVSQASAASAGISEVRGS